MRQILTFKDILEKKKPTEKWLLYIGLNMSGVDDLTIKGGEDPASLHVTLLYGYYTPTGTREAAELSVQRAIESIEDFIPEQIEFDATGRFEASESSDGLDVIFARVKAGQLEKAHEAVIEALAKEGIEVEKTFPEYHPHMTLAYIDPEEDFPLEPIKATGTIKDITIGAGPDEEPVNKTEETQTFHIEKTDNDKRLVFGWANIAFTADGEQIEDLQHDIIDTEDLEEAVYKYVLEFRDGGEEHIPSMRKKATLVESVMFTKEKMKAMGIPEGIVPEGWWIGFYVKDDDAWEKIKNGTYQMFSIEGTAIREKMEDDIEKADRINGCGVLVVKDGKILTGTRIGGKHANQICGPGGHIEAGETHEEAAIRETREEFGIECKELVPLGILDNGRSYGKSAVFLCTEYDGEPHTDEEEMTDVKWRTPSELEEERLFYPFELSLDLLADRIEKANPYHDERGRFTTASGGGLKITYNSIEAQAVESDSMAASYLMNTGMPFDEIMTAFNNGTATAKAKEVIDQKYSELQKRYASATPGQKKLMEMTPEEAAEFIKASQEAETPSNLNTGSTTQRVIHQLGMHEKPTVLSREEFEEVAKESPSGKIYRGVRDNSNVGVTADEIAEMTVNGDQTFLGYGIHSDGIYFSTKTDTARHFVGQSGAAVEACISPKARVADFNDLTLERAKDPQGYTISDMGTYALHKGYNALKVPADAAEDYYIALDRTALVFPNDFKVNLGNPDAAIYLTLMNKAKKTINGEELGKVFNAFAFQTTAKNKSKNVAKAFSEVVAKFNPFHDALGRFASSSGFATYSANPKTKAGAMAISRSAQAGHGTTFNSHKESQGENINQNYAWLNGGPGAKQLGAQGQLASQQPKTPPKPQKNYDRLGFADSDDADYHQLYNGRQYYQQQQLSTATKNACDKYLNPNTEAGSLYNFSQNMNHAVVTGTINRASNKKYKAVYDELCSNMHNLGHNVTLTRYDHGGFLDDQLAQVGITSRKGMSVAQMRKALVGHSYGDNRILSTSYNDFQKASNHSTFSTREVKVVYKAKASTQVLMPGDGPGGKFGEMLIGPTGTGGGNKYTIVDVNLTGGRARAKGSSPYNLSLKQIEVVVEVG